MNRKKFTFKTILVEILIVIIGISIAFWVNNWGEERKERALEIEFLRTMHSELAVDSSAFVYQIKANEENYRRLERLTQMCRTRDFSNDSIQWYVGNFLNRNNWIVNANTYETLKSGGNLDVITDFELRNEISSFYKIRKFQADRMLEVIQTFLDNQMFPYLTKNSDYFISNKPDIDFLVETEFQNLLAQWSDLNYQKLSVYKDILHDISGLISKFEAEMN